MPRLSNITSQDLTSIPTESLWSSIIRDTTYHYNYFSGYRPWYADEEQLALMLTTISQSPKLKKLLRDIVRQRDMEIE